MNVLEMRRAPRFKGSLPVLLDKGTGVTRDYSTAGIYFVTDNEFAEGSQLSFIILFNHLDAGKQMRVNCRGTVVRIRPDNGRCGIAVQLNAHDFVI